jgi:hypothetical protein
LLPRFRTSRLSFQLEGDEGVHHTQVSVFLDQECSSCLWSTILIYVSSGPMFVVALLT